MRALFIKITTRPAHPFDNGAAAARALRELADRLENFGLNDDTFCNLRDGAGNNIGHAGMDDANSDAPKAYR